MATMLATAARRSVLVGMGTRRARRCRCHDCDVSKTKSAQRRVEARSWRSEEEGD